MTVTRVKIEAIPPSRFQNSLLSDTQEWKEAVEEIKKGLTPQEAIRVSLSPETIAQLTMKQPARAFYVALKRFVKHEKLPVEVTSRAIGKGQEDFDIWIVGQASR